MSKLIPDWHNTVLIEPFLSPRDCDELLQKALSLSWQRGTVGREFGEVVSKQVVGEERSCWLSRLDDAALIQRVIKLANRRFAAEGTPAFSINEKDSAAIMAYDLGDHYQWHIDCGSSLSITQNRALSFSIQLCRSEDYQGGNLEFTGGIAENEKSLLRQQGSITLFPPRAPHRITPVTEGVRLAVVGWLYIVSTEGDSSVH